MNAARIAACIATASLALASYPAMAAADCNGTITASWINELGNVYIHSSWRNDHTQICNVRSEWKSIPADLCLAWTAKLDSAVALDRTIVVSYDEYSSLAECATIPTYGNAPSPRYVMLK